MSYALLDFQGSNVNTYEDWMPDQYHPVLTLIPSFSLLDVLLIWRKGTLFEAMTGRTAPLSDGLLAEVF